MLVLTACNMDIVAPTTKERITGNRRHRRFKKIGSIFGKEGMTWRPSVSTEKTTIPKSSSNPSNLFQVALDAIAQYPIASSDSAAGIIVTDWKIDTPTSRSKVIVRIVCGQPQVKVFEQTYREGTWWDAPQATAQAEILRKDILKKSRKTAK
ncbi:MAG: DUF3576 domain-containing protein [Holosporales bacterium]|nr:DUF3576 domain-containing protein [Holosporales bacterium]